MAESLTGLPFVPGGSALQLLYNGTTYSDLSANFIVASMSFSGPKVTAPNTLVGDPGGNYSASVSNVPFSMTGTVTVHTGSATGPVVLSIPISGSGLYASTQRGNILASGPGGIPTGTVTYQFLPPSPTMFGLDTSTQGAWTGKYGADGYLIANGATKLPSYASVNVAGDIPYTWANQSTDPRALQNGPNSTLGIASAYTQYPNQPFTININFTDGKTHRVALYALDWDSVARAETVTIRDAATNAVLDSELLSNFNPGQYATWNLQGNVVITVTPSAGTSAVVSGIFFDPVTTNQTQPSFNLTATAATTPATIPAGSFGQWTVTVTPLNGFASPVTLATSGWPAGITGTFVSNPTSTSTRVTIDVGSSVAAGPYSLTLNGSSGSLSASTTIALTVTAAPPPPPPSGFTVVASSVTVAAGSNGITTLTITPSPAPGNLFLSTSWPSGITIGDLPTGALSYNISVATSVTPGLYSLPFRIYNAGLTVDASSTIALTVTAGQSLGSSAVYVGTDSATQGAWNGKYGADGYLIANLPGALPSYAAVGVTGTTTYTWAGLTSDVRALQSGKGQTNGYASAYNGNTFNISVNLTDGNTHQVGLYLLDWDSTSRLESITVVDAATNAVLDFERFTGFHNGQWAVWNLKGNVILKVVTGSTGFNALFSGIFFGPVGAPPPPPSFTLSATQATVAAGASGSSTVTVTPVNGFVGAVTLSTINWPAGIMATFGTNPATNTSIATISVGSSVAAGTYSLGLGGSSGSLSATGAISLTVTSVATGGGFYLTPTLATIIAPGSAGASRVTITQLNGFASPVNLTASGWPAGITGVAATYPAVNSSDFWITCAAGVTPGNYSLTVIGTSGSLTASTTIPLTVLADGAPRFRMNASNAIAAPGTNGLSRIDVVGSLGFASPVNLATSGWPAGITGVFDVNPTSGSSNVIISVGSGVAPGPYGLNVIGTNGALTFITTIGLTVGTGGAPGFALIAPARSITAGTTGATIVTVAPLNGFASPVTLSTAGWPAGITGTIVTNPTTNNTDLLITVGVGVAVGQYPLVVNGTSGVLTASTTIALTVGVGVGQPPPLILLPRPTSIAAGGSGSTILDVEGDSFSRVHLTTSGWPAGITGTFSLNDMMPSYETVVVINVGAGVTPGLYSLNVIGTSSTGWSMVGTISLTVNPSSNLTSSATYLGSDTSHLGTWTGVYGNAGYIIANGANVQPSYGSASVIGASTFTWAGQTTDQRALQTSPGSTTRIASTYTQYPNASFTINVSLNDANVHQVSFYMLAWDTSGAQSITILDAATNTVLDTQTVYFGASFFSWNIKGNVIVKVTPNPGFSPAVSGIFFN